MGIRVNPSKAFSVAVSYVEPGFDAAWKEVEAAVSYIQTVATASWMDVGVMAEVTFPDVYTVEVVTPTDLVALTTTKNFADSVDNSDEKVLLVSPTYAETVPLADSASRVVDFIRNYSDSAALADVATRSTSLDKQEGLAASDSSSLATVKGLSEGLTLTDNMDGDIEYQIVKVTSEVLTAAEQQVIDFAGQSSDNILTSSSGVLAVQDYSDITYFLQDYVGLTRTFT